MTDKSTIHIYLQHKIILIGIGVSVIFWIIESYIHTFVFHQGTLLKQILSPDPHEFWMRSLVSFRPETN